jgi:hypothetical protein
MSKVKFLFILRNCRYESFIVWFFKVIYCHYNTFSTSHSIFYFPKPTNRCVIWLRFVPPHYNYPFRVIILNFYSLSHLLSLNIYSILPFIYISCLFYSFIYLSSLVICSKILFFHLSPLNSIIPCSIPNSHLFIILLFLNLKQIFQLSQTNLYSFLSIYSSISLNPQLDSYISQIHIYNILFII